jgi:hypothetical protein
LLGLKGTMSEFELSLIRKRLVDAAVAKARRGELRIGVPVGYVWSRDEGLMMAPDRRIQDVIRTIFRLFERLGSATQVLRHMRREGLLFPRPADGRNSPQLVWRAPAYRNIIAVLQNPFYAGAYAYGSRRSKQTLSTVLCESATADGSQWLHGRFLRVITMRLTSPGRCSSSTAVDCRKTHSNNALAARSRREEVRH